MRKLVFLINSLHNTGGTERMTTLLANYWANKGGVSVCIVSIHKGEKPFFELSNEVKIYYIKKSRKSNIYIGYLPNLFKVRKIARNIQPDYWIDVCSAMSLISIPALIGMNIRILSWEHFNANVEWNPITSNLARRLAARYAEKIVVLTQDDKSIFKMRYHADNVVCIPNPITIRVDKPSPLDVRCVLAIGRFTYQKGFDMLIDAWALTKCRKEGWQLRILGGGELESSLRKQALCLNLDSIVFEPFCQDVISLYRNASMYVMSSRFEGLPLVLIEALAMGLPIVSFDCETGPKDIVDNGVNGVLVPTGDVEMLAKEIDELAGNVARQHLYAKHALTKSEEFKVEKIIHLWEKLIK